MPRYQQVLWPEGKVVFKPGGAGVVLENGALSMKFPWWRIVRGRLTIEGRRLDGPAPLLRARIPDGYGEIGFQATALIFPTPGCWEVTGRVDDQSLTLAVWAWCCWRLGERSNPLVRLEVGSARTQLYRGSGGDQCPAAFRGCHAKCVVNA